VVALLGVINGVVVVTSSIVASGGGGRRSGDPAGEPPARAGRTGPAAGARRPAARQLGAGGPDRRTGRGRVSPADRRTGGPDRATGPDRRIGAERRERVFVGFSL
jgi:hypothetical protein